MEADCFLRTYFVEKFKKLSIQKIQNMLKISENHFLIGMKTFVLIKNELIIVSGKILKHILVVTQLYDVNNMFRAIIGS